MVGEVGVPESFLKNFFEIIDEVRKDCGSFERHVRSHPNLVDCREPAEWADTGVVTTATLLAKSDFDGAQKEWKPFLEKNAGKEIILYCRSGTRAGIVGKALAAQGVKVSNAGGFKAWADAGQPTRKVEAKK